MKPQICLVPKLDGLGGMVSFQAKFKQGLTARNIPTCFDLNNPDNKAVLVIGGTRHIWQLWRAKRRHVRIVQRLNGLNWRHKVEQTPLQRSLKAELNNQLIAFIRRFLADAIVYQSEFSQWWWNRVFGQISIPTQVTHNGIDLAQYNPTGPEQPPQDHFRILLVEGHMTAGQTWGLETAVLLAGFLKEMHDLSVELMVVGDVSDAVKAHAYALAPRQWINWVGVVPRTEIPALDRAAHVLFSADLNAACPNSVIEAMACGLPILAYDTGALKELVPEGAGAVVPYGADYWQLEKSRIEPLAQACIEIFQNNAAYRQGARLHAETHFRLDAMVESYLEALVP